MTMLNYLKTIIDLLAEIVSLLRILKNLAMTSVSANELPDTEQIIDLLQKIATNTQPLATTPILTQRKIYKAEAIKLLGISSRTYDRKKASGLLVPRGTGHDFYYPEDLEKAMEESIRRGRV